MITMTEQTPPWAETPEAQETLPIEKAAVQDANGAESRIRELERRLEEANELILELSESGLELDEARELMSKADAKTQEADNTLNKAYDAYNAARKEQKDYAETKAQIDKERAAWDKTKEKQDKAFNKRVRKKTKAETAKYKASYAAIALYGIALTLYIFLAVQNGIEDVIGMVNYFAGIAKGGAVWLVLRLIGTIMIPIGALTYGISVHTKEKLWDHHNLNVILVSSLIVILSDISPLYCNKIALFLGLNIVYVFGRAVRYRIRKKG